MRRRFITNRKIIAGGVYILHQNGTLLKRDEWHTNYNTYAVGVAVVTPVHSFVIAKSNVTMSMWGPSGSPPGVSTFEGVYVGARSDYLGKSNTDAILNYHGTGGYAASYCYNYTSLDGNKWYLPAAGEFHLASQYISEINECLALIGGTRLSSGNYWTSTQWNRDSAWVYDLNGVGCWGTPKSKAYTVRPFASL